MKSWHSDSSLTLVTIVTFKAEKSQSPTKIRQVYCSAAGKITENNLYVTFCWVTDGSKYIRRYTKWKQIYWKVRTQYGRYNMKTACMIAHCYHIYIIPKDGWMHRQTQEDPEDKFQETSEYRRACSIQTLRWRRRQRRRTMRRRKRGLRGNREEVRWGFLGQFTKSQIGN